MKLRFIVNKNSEQRAAKPVQEKQCQAWPETGSESIVSGGDQLVEQTKAKYPEETVAGYVEA